MHRAASRGNKTANTEAAAASYWVRNNLNRADAGWKRKKMIQLCLRDEGNYGCQMDPNTPNKRYIYLLVGNVGQHSGNDLQQENTHQQTQILQKGTHEIRK